MKAPLDILRSGAVTALGLTGPQTCAAVRAGLCGFRQAFPLPPPMEPLVAAQVPARAHLKVTDSDWLVNLAAKAIAECLAPPTPVRTAVIVNLPESARAHPALRQLSPKDWLSRLQQRLRPFQPAPILAAQEGRAGPLRLISQAAELIDSGHADYCVVGGVDSLLNDQDVGRLSAAFRLRGPEVTHGLTPGEGAVFLLLGRPNPPVVGSTRVLGVGFAREKDPVTGPRLSQGRGLQEAVSLAVKAAGIREDAIQFRISDANGEKYHAWESLLASSRFYRTRRPHFPCWYGAPAVGDLGAAAGALTLALATAGFARGYSPGDVAVCEASSDEGLRAACVVGRVQPRR
jgi:3-oxoacyl-[acyl-carrier-protein] synthase-1